MTKEWKIKWNKIKIKIKVKQNKNRIQNVDRNINKSKRK